jgi:hypothetical protein
MWFLEHTDFKFKYTDWNEKDGKPIYHGHHLEERWMSALALGAGGLGAGILSGRQRDILGQERNVFIRRTQA